MGPLIAAHIFLPASALKAAALPKCLKICSAHTGVHSFEVAQVWWSVQLFNVQLLISRNHLHPFKTNAATHSLTSTPTEHQRQNIHGCFAVFLHLWILFFSVYSFPSSSRGYLSAPPPKSSYLCPALVAQNIGWSSQFLLACRLPPRIFISSHPIISPQALVRLSFMTALVENVSHTHHLWWGEATNDTSVSLCTLYFGMGFWFTGGLWTEWRGLIQKFHWNDL